MANIKATTSLLLTNHALSAIGNVELMKIWQSVLSKYGLLSSQILLNSEVDNGEYVNHLQQLISHNVICIINENDILSTRERNKHIMFVDNDTLAATIANELNADTFSIFSSGIKGYYKNYGTHSQQIIESMNINEIQEAIDYESDIHSNSTKTESGTAGILTKLKAMYQFLLKNQLGVGLIFDSNNYELENLNGTNFKY
jgi:glutamate 5-kinase